MEEVEQADVERFPIIYNIQRYSLQDGPGSRTTIFVKGCPLRCPWCHNPETQREKPELSYNEDKCTGCGLCIQACPEKAIYTEDGALLLDRQKCTGCGACARVCVAGAREGCGRKMTMDEIVREAKKDEMFYMSSDGGVTISGGEPMFYPAFTLELARRLSEDMIHVALETAACCRWEDLEKLTPYVDLFLVDLKTTDEEKCRTVVNANLPVIKNNIENLVRSGASVRVRIPVIPGFNDSEEDFTAFSEYLGKLRTMGLEGVDILPFHSYAAKKYKTSGQWSNYKYKDTESMPSQDVKPLAMKLKAQGFSGQDSSLTIGALTGKTL